MVAAFAAADVSGDAIGIGVKTMLWQLRQLKRFGFYIGTKGNDAIFISGRMDEAHLGNEDKT